MSNYDLGIRTQSFTSSDYALISQDEISLTPLNSEDDWETTFLRTCVFNFLLS